MSFFVQKLPPSFNEHEQGYSGFGIISNIKSPREEIELNVEDTALGVLEKIVQALDKPSRGVTITIYSNSIEEEIGVFNDQNADSIDKKLQEIGYTTLGEYLQKNVGKDAQDVLRIDIWPIATAKSARSIINP